MTARKTVKSFCLMMELQSEIRETARVRGDSSTRDVPPPKNRSPFDCSPPSQSVIAALPRGGQSWQPKMAQREFGRGILRVFGRRSILSPKFAFYLKRNEEAKKPLSLY